MRVVRRRFLAYAWSCRFPAALRWSASTPGRQSLGGARSPSPGTAVGKPVQVMWTREDDLQNGAYRPAAFHLLRATLDAHGRPQSWQHGLAAQSMGSSVGEGAQPPYTIPAVQVTGAEVSLGVPVTIWRGAEYSYTTFAVESFMDEIAAATHAEPYQFRRGLLDSTPRLRAALDLAASKADWSSPLPAKSGRGIGACV